MTKDTYEHFMLKEIDEQPEVMRRLIEKYQDRHGNSTLAQQLAGLQLPRRIYLVGCGSSYHAALIGKRFFEQLARIPAEVHTASELQYDQILIEDDALFLLISQSGETADARGVLAQVQGKYPTLTITNVPGSTLAEEADFALYTYAGTEVAIASTKAFTAQLAVLALVAQHLAEIQGLPSAVEIALFEELERVAQAMSTLLTEKAKAKAVLDSCLGAVESCFFIGRLADYPVALEGALKLKETSYIVAHGYAAGEFRHGPIALIEEGTPIFVLATDARVVNSIRTNTAELQSRGAKTCVISVESLAEAGDAWVLPEVHPLLTPLLAVLPLQLIAYYAAVERGLNVDQPRNLTKAVVSE